MSDIIDLAHGTLNGADTILIELIQPDNHPPVVRITWPTKSTIIPPARFTAAAAAEAARLFAAASTNLAQIKAQR